jgi:hypothetical protein
LAHGLGWVAAQEVLCPWLEGFRQHLFTVSESYWSGLFVCYDVMGLSRTINGLERIFLVLYLPLLCLLVPRRKNLRL